MITILDVETSFIIKNDKKVPSPYLPENKLVSVGWCGLDDEDVQYRFFNHNDKTFNFDPIQAKADLQAVLSDTTVLVGHNIKFDLAWLLESGLVYTGRVYDTMVAEYVLARGLKWALSLKDSAIRRDCISKKLDIVDHYMASNVSFENIPPAIIEEYGKVDVLTTRDLYKAQQLIYAEQQNFGLISTRDMMNEFLVVLTDMERNGIRIDMDALDAIDVEFRAEKQKLDRRLLEIAQQVMGDKPYNLNSPEQLSQVIYSRSLKNKKRWVELFNIGYEERGSVRRPKYKTKMHVGAFANVVRAETDIVYRTNAHQCGVCYGRGSSYKTTKTGRDYKKPTSCSPCEGTGVQYQKTETVAGLKLSPSGYDDTAAVGFATDADTLDLLIAKARSPLAKEFLTSMVRANALETYLASFVEGIRKHVGSNCILHPRLNQCITATGRLSSTEPNFQNQPRGNTFPIRRVVVSRWGEKGGKVLVADYAQLEFRSAAFQSQDAVAIAEIKAGVDVHAFTRDILASASGIVIAECTKEQLSDLRQNAKQHTFKPLYGGQSGTEAERAYYKAFGDKFTGIAEWQKELQEHAIKYRKIRTPSGREYVFPGAERNRWGGSTFSTQIKNYPVQGFATGDVVPIANILVYRLFKLHGVKSLMVNTVHDNIVVDVYPGEEELVTKLVSDGMLGILDDLITRYDCYFNVPLQVEIKMGANELETKKIGVFDREGVFR